MYYQQCWFEQRPRCRSLTNQSLQICEWALVRDTVSKNKVESNMASTCMHTYVHIRAHTCACMHTHKQTINGVKYNGPGETNSFCSSFFITRDWTQDLTHALALSYYTPGLPLITIVVVSYYTIILFSYCLFVVAAETRLTLKPRWSDFIYVATLTTNSRQEPPTSASWFLKFQTLATAPSWFLYYILFCFCLEARTLLR